MAFTIEEFHDLIRILEERPEWRQELRRLVLTEEFLDLPRIMRDLAAEVRALAEAQRRAEERLERLEGTVAALAEAQRRAEEQLQSLAGTVERLTRRVDRLSEELGEVKADVAKIKEDVGELKGSDLARRYRERAAAYFGRHLRRVEVIPSQELARLLDRAADQGRVTWEEREEILWADIVVRGETRAGREVYLVIEVSWGVGPSDVERAVARAARLAKVVGSAVPGVAGQAITAEAREAAERHKVVQVTDGRVAWPEG